MKTQTRNYWKTSDIKVTTDPDGCFSATHRWQGDLVVSMIYKDRNEARREAVKTLKEMKERQ